MAFWVISGVATINPHSPNRSIEFTLNLSEDWMWSIGSKDIPVQLEDENEQFHQEPSRNLEVNNYWPLPQRLRRPVLHHFIHTMLFSALDGRHSVTTPTAKFQASRIIARSRRVHQSHRSKMRMHFRLQ